MPSPRETLKTPEKTYHQEFAKAKREFYQITASTEDQYIEEGAELDQVPRGEYWLRVAANGRKKINDELSHPEQLSYAKLIEVTSLAPAALLAQRQLRQMQHPAYGRAEKDLKASLVGLVCRFNRSISDYACAQPEVKAHELAGYLDNVISIGLEAPVADIRPHISTIIKGVQQEVAMGDLLFDATDSRVSSLEEDLTGGDYIMRMPIKDWGPNAGAKIDIKASSAKLSRSETGQVDIQHGSIILRSLFADEDLDGSFHPSQEAIKRNSSKLEILLKEAYRMSDRGRMLDKVDFE